MSFSIRQRPSFASATAFRENSTRQQSVLTEQVQSIDLSTSLNQRPDQQVQNRFNNPQLQNNLNSLVGNDLITNQKLNMVNDFLNQIHIDPMVGFEEGALEQAMNQFDKIQQMIQDQVLNNNTGQGDYKTTTTEGDGYKTTTVTNSNGETRQSYTKHDSGHSRDQSSTGDVKHKDGKGNVITEKEYCEETENRADDCPEEDNTGGEGSGNGDGNGNNDENKIIAETEWPMGYQLNDFVGNHESSAHSMGIDLQLVQSMHQTEYFFSL